MRHASELTSDRSMRFPLTSFLLVASLSIPVEAQSNGSPARFPWPADRSAPTVGGVALGATVEALNTAFGRADASIDVGPRGMRLFFFRGGRLKVALGSGGVESIFVEAPDTTSVDSVRVGAPGITALDRWGDPARLDRETGAAVWVGPGWELQAYLASDGQRLRALELRRPRALPAAMPRAP